MSMYSVIANIPSSLYESHRNIITSANGHTLPLTRTPYENEQEYYEIEILSERTMNTELPLKKNMDEILNLNKYTCHICNIEVPKTYVKEHNSSNKHMICNEIANLALDRTKLQMQLEISGSRKVEIEDTYFCEPCALVVFNTDKVKHEATKIHKISCKHDELLKDLLKIYSDINNVEVNSEVDELDLLQQRIELVSLEEESGLQKRNTDSFKSLERVDRVEVESLKEDVINVAGEITEMRTLIDRMTVETAKIIGQSNALTDHMNEFANNKFDDKIEDLNEAVLAVKMSRNSKNKALKRHQIGKKIERFQNKDKASRPMTENTSAVMDNQPKASDCSSPTGISKKIDEILSKYFDSSCTVDALNNNAVKEHNKKKTNKEPNNTKTNNDNNKNREEKGEQNVNKDQSVNGKEINKNLEQKDNFENKQTSNIREENVKNKQINLSEHNEDNKEQNNNKLSEENNNKIAKQNKIKKNKDTKNNKDIKEMNKISKPNCSQTPNFNLVFYLKDITRRCLTKPIHTVEATTDNIVQITAINGDKIKVHVNNFHSFHVKASNIYCKLCESPNVRRPEWHIIENEHRDKVMIPIKDLNGIRQIDDIWSHCLICNDYTSDTEFHLRSLLHNNKLKHSLIELGNKSDSDDDNNKTNQKTRPKKNTDADQNSLICKNHLTETSKGYLNCVICEVIVNSDCVSVEQHITSFEHLNNYEQQQNNNKLIDVDTSFYCIGCDVNFYKSDFLRHCNGRKHKKHLQEVLQNQGEDCEEEVDDTQIALPSISQNVKKQYKGDMECSELICFVCNIIIYCIDEHTDSFEHKKNYFSYLESNKLNEIEPDTFYCIPCNTVITINYLMSHCTSRKHRTVLKNFIGSKNTEEDVQKGKDKTAQSIQNTKTTQVPSTSQTKTVSKSNKKMPLKVLYQFREIYNSTKLLCTVCDEEIPYNRKQASDHICTLDHVVAFNLMMLWNKIKKQHDKYFCDICRIDMTYFSEITHVLGKQHAGNLAKEPKGTVYEYERTLLTHAYAMSLQTGSRTRLSSVLSVSKPQDT